MLLSRVDIALLSDATRSRAILRRDMSQPLGVVMLLDDQLVSRAIDVDILAEHHNVLGLAEDLRNLLQRDALCLWQQEEERDATKESANRSAIGDNSRTSSELT